MFLDLIIHIVPTHQSDIVYLKDISYLQYTLEKSPRCSAPVTLDWVVVLGV